MIDRTGQVFQERADLFTGEFTGATQIKSQGGRLMDGEVGGRPLGGISIVKRGQLFHDERTGENGGRPGVSVCAFEGDGATGLHAQVGSIGPQKGEATGPAHATRNRAIANQVGD